MMQTKSEPPPRMPRQFKKNPIFNGNGFVSGGGGVLGKAAWGFRQQPSPIDLNLKISDLGVEANGENGEMCTPPCAVKSPSAVAMAAVSSSTTQEMSSTTTTTTSSRVAKTSQRIMSSSEMKASTLKSDLSELKSSISEMKNLSSSTFGRLRSSVEDLCGVEDEGGGGGSGEPLVTFPDPDTPPPLNYSQPPLIPITGGMTGSSDQLHQQGQHMKIEQKRVTSASNTKVIMDRFSAERAMANSAEMKRVQTGEMTYQESQQAAQRRARLEVDGVTAEKAVNIMQEKKSLKTEGVTQHEMQNKTASMMQRTEKIMTSEKNTMDAHRETVVSGMNHTILTHKYTSGTVSSTNNKMLLETMKMIDEESKINLSDLENLSVGSPSQEVERAKVKYTKIIEDTVGKIKTMKGEQTKKVPQILNGLNEMIKKAWGVPAFGHELGSALCNSLRVSGGIDFLLTNNADDEQQFASAKLLEQCLTSENRDYVVQNGLEMVVTSACVCTKNLKSVEHSRVGTGILEHLFKHSEGTCSDVISLGGLDAVLFECRKNDIETLRHCASALANLSLYGGADNHEQMIKRKVPVWLFPLAFHHDDNIKYYACLAIAALVANKEIEASVLQSGTLDLVEPFITTHTPKNFAKSNLAYAHGQSKQWLKRLVPVLSSKREEARNLAAFHFCMEAGIKQQQGNTDIFREIGVIEPLKKVASCPNATASKFACQALLLIGEDIPHKLSQQVPLWSQEDVREWVIQIGFAEYAPNFVDSKVDGDLLLQLTEDNLLHDIGIKNGIRRKRFTRELQILKKMADYSSKDSTNMNGFLSTLGPEFCTYTYNMINAGVDRDTMKYLSDDQLLRECGITNSIHRYRILDSIDGKIESPSEENLDKSLDVFISYRRSNGSQLASLLKVHLQLRGFSVFIDVERLEAGKFDNNLLQSIRTAKHFILVLTPNALDRCLEDDECKDWVHREIVAALQAQCNIIPIIDNNFAWPHQEKLPDDMRQVCSFNGINWIHDYQDACVEKLERFMRGESRAGTVPSRAGDVTPGTPSISHKPVFNRNHSNMTSDGSDGSRD